MNIIEQNINVRSEDFHTVLVASSDAIGNILMVHGFGEHIGRYSEMMNMFQSLGMNVFGYDRRGEGRSGGRRAYIEEMEDQVADLVAMRSTLITNELPTYIYAHSLGGLITTKYLIDYQDHGLAGAILSGALLKVDDDISPLLQKMSGLVAAVLPKIQTVKVDTSLLSRNPEVEPAYIADPHNYHGGTPARTGHQILISTAYVQSYFHNIKLPLLITHGGADKLADPQGSRWMFEKVSSPDKTLKVFEGLYHEIMHEPEKDEVYDCMKEWLKERV